MQRVSFVEWLARVDAWLECHMGMGHDDLPDCPYRDWYDDGISPSVAGCMVRREAMGS